MKKTLSLVLSLIMAITCVFAIPTMAYANKPDDAPEIKVGGMVKASISEKTDYKSDENFYAKFVPETTGYYEFYTKNDSKLKSEEALVAIGIIEFVKGEETLVGNAIGMISGDPMYTEIFGERSLTVAAKLTKGKTYYVSIEGMDFGTFSTEVYCKSGHNHSYETYVDQACADSEYDFFYDGEKYKTCPVCGDQKTIEKYYYPKTVTLSAESYTYDGKAKKPKVTVKDRKGNVISSKNYKVKYSSNKNVGTAKVSIVFNEKKYSGELVKTFTINPAKTSIKKLSAIKKGFKVTWAKKTTQVDSYQIRYSTSSKMTAAKTTTVKGAKSTSKEIKGLKAGKKYFVQVRTCKKVNGKTYFSDWSSISKVTTKK